MSNVSTVYDNIITKIGTTISTYTRIPNPYEPSENPSLFMRKGYGVGFGAGRNTNRMVCDKVSISRAFTILLMNEVLTTEMNVSSRGSFEKSLLEDQFLLIQAFENDLTLSGACVKIAYSDDTGIQYVEGGSEKFILVETTFEVEYFESI